MMKSISGAVTANDVQVLPPSLMVLRYRSKNKTHMRLEQRNNALLMILFFSKFTLKPIFDLTIPSSLFQHPQLFRRRQLRDRLIGYGLDSLRTHISNYSSRDRSIERLRGRSWADHFDRFRSVGTETNFDTKHCDSISYRG